MPCLQGQLPQCAANVSNASKTRCLHKSSVIRFQCFVMSRSRDYSSWRGPARLMCFLESMILVLAWRFTSLSVPAMAQGWTYPRCWPWPRRSFSIYYSACFDPKKVRRVFRAEHCRDTVGRQPTHRPTFLPTDVPKSQRASCFRCFSNPRVRAQAKQATSWSVSGWKVTSEGWQKRDKEESGDFAV